MRERMLEKFGGASSFKLGQRLQPQAAKYETGKREEERWCETAWQLSTGKPIEIIGYFSLLT